LLTRNRPSSEEVKKHCFFWDEELQRSFFDVVNSTVRAKGIKDNSMEGNEWNKAGRILPEVLTVLEGNNVCYQTSSEGNKKRKKHAKCRIL
jgi:hypothetical protein